MRHRISLKTRIAQWSLFLLVASLIILNAMQSLAIPSGPTVTFLSNETKQLSGARTLNTSGGSISTVFLNATTQNLRWKAYVGNITGKLTLDDANDNTLFDWSLTSINGEIYATRYSGTLNWNNVNCSNLTQIETENRALNHSNKDDNITTTFASQIHRSFYVGTRQIQQNTCRSIHTYVNSTSQTTSFEQIILYDGTNDTNGNIIYATPLEQDRYGFDSGIYDFQMIVPEVGLSSWSGSTAYYFYAELT